jgi:hypothetical protein
MPAPRHEDALTAWRDAFAFGWGALATSAALADPRDLRARWLADLRRIADESLRSGAFLALLKFNLTLMARRT